MSSIKISELQELRERIMRFRAEHDLTQTEFAEMCGLTKPTIGAIETGGYRPGRDTISEITMLKITSFLDRARDAKREEI